MRKAFWVRSRLFQGRSLPQGFTLLESLVIVVIVGVLAAIVVPSWNVLLTSIRLNAAQDQVLQAMQRAKSNAKRKRTVEQFSIRTKDGIVQWALSPATPLPDESLWQNLDPAIQLDDETSLRSIGSIRRVQFTHEGRVNGSLGRVTFSSKQGGKLKRCVVVSTLLGTLRTGTDKPTKKDGYFCY
jgi:prepilin-type N-terminal cleavage/methylation domain-containing protein